MARIIFMGTPEFSVPCVHALAAHPDAELVAVVCQPDKRHGRHKTPQPPPVKQAAVEHDITVFQPRKLRSGPFPDQLCDLKPDLIVVTAYGRILPPAILNLPTIGCVNIHASLLPRWRGAAPIQWSIAEGDLESGVCLMEMEEGLDTGGVFAHSTTPIQRDDTGQTLHDRLSQLGAELLSEHLSALIAGQLKLIPQNEEYVTYARMLNRSDGRIDWALTAAELNNRIRGFYPWPGAWTTLSSGGLKLKLFPHCQIVEGQGTPGTVIQVDDSGLTIACGKNALHVSDVQLEGRRRMPISDMLRGFELPAGTVLE